MNIDNLTEVDQNVEERFELSETESNRHQNEKLQTQDVFEVSFAFSLNVCVCKKSFFVSSSRPAKLGCLPGTGRQIIVLNFCFLCRY